MKLQHTSKQKMNVAGIGQTDDHGVIEVTDEQAGHAPDPRIEEIFAALNVEPRLEHEEIVRLKDELAGLDHGSGFLAQDTWKPFGSKAKAALKQEDDK